VIRRYRAVRSVGSLVVVSIVLVSGLAACGSSASKDATGGSSADTSADAVPETTVVPGPPLAPEGPPTTDRTMALAQKIGGDISPKSVVASGRGLVFAENMMYKHSVTVYASDGSLKTTIPDTVKLSDYGFDQYTGASYRGAPVEVAFAPDVAHAYVTNYSMYGKGFGPEGNDNCQKNNKVDSSFVYRIDTSTLAIDQVIAVGKVPKYAAVTPDGRYLLVSNWCSYDLSVVDLATGKEVKRIPLGPYPRGIAVAPDSSAAYVAVMGTSDMARIDLFDLSTSWFRGVGTGPRHVVISPDGKTLFATLNSEGKVVKIDATTGKVITKVSTGKAPRSMAISTDGLSLYVVNYESDAVSKLRASDMKVLQSIPTSHHPIGITYDAATGNVWVACYVGTIMVFTDK
jgi:YVTN family beta-propeller protein